MLNTALLRRGAPRRQRGLSIVEMLVGVAVGLIVVAGATVLVTTQLVENRRLLVETQLQQDLRAAMDIMARELRRVGAQGEVQTLRGLWFEGSVVPSGSEDNIYFTGPNALSAPGTNIVEFAYNPEGGKPDGPFGFKLDNGVIKTKLDNAGWQDLTDGSVMSVTAFSVTPVNRAVIQLPCAKQCPGLGGGTACWPSVQVRELVVSISASASAASGVNRTMRSTVRLRNDFVRYFDPVADQICPS
jgi:type IV pilus assembly protein PilW